MFDSEKTEMLDPEKEEKIISSEKSARSKLIDLDKIYDLLHLYKIPLIFLSLGLIMLLTALIFWQSSNRSAEIVFSGENEASEKSSIKADIEGAVIKPGVYELNSGSRISDLLMMAGGLALEADREWVTKNLNLAGKVVDGGKIYIPEKEELRELERQGRSGNLGTFGTLEKINLNSASQLKLESLAGIGPVTAGKIISGRPYQTIDELVQKKIVGQSVFEKIREKITAY